MSELRSCGMWSRGWLHTMPVTNVACRLHVAATGTSFAGKVRRAPPRCVAACKSSRPRYGNIAWLINQWQVHTSARHAEHDYWCQSRALAACCHNLRTRSSSSMAMAARALDRCLMGKSALVEGELQDAMRPTKVGAILREGDTAAKS